MKKFIFLLIIFLSACGYQPIYVNKIKDKIEFSKISLSGNEEINFKILRSINIKENEKNNLNTDLELKSNFKVEETSKNSKGQTTSFRSVATIELTIKKDNEIQKNKVFSQDFTYANKDNKYDLVKYQSEIKNNILDKIIEEIILYLNL